MRLFRRSTVPLVVARHFRAMAAASLMLFYDVIKIKYKRYKYPVLKYYCYQYNTVLATL